MATLVSAWFVGSYGVAVPVEFLTDQEAAVFGRYGGSPSREELERFFFLDDGDRKLAFRRRGDHNRLGFSLQLTTARYIGRFLPDPLEGVPTEVIDYLAEQLQIADPSCVKRYAQREPTHREHAGEIQRVLGLKDFAEVEAQLVPMFQGPSPMSAALVSARTPARFTSVSWVCGRVSGSPTNTTSPPTG
jgi:hypothetical protein